ncbi:prepilin-type N-terminal cleavage/methylation domain-containing protein [Amphritea sp.]|uniref:prepilin-type N-terminal cleavage/methylation domain-containing protein n=1 Tax=Amphritea sp. TaxID=1872502 RepID=UPI0025B9C085|nr:prepilin-type N-terminal cleavage/methylation domain-containing protein [Amphritea sp.]
MNKHLNKGSGFTLLEMLVAMAITSVLLTVIYGSFYQGIRSWQSISAHNEAEQQQFLLRQHLRQQLQSSLLINTSQDRNSNIEFIGREDHLEFIAQLSPLQGNAGLYNYRITLQDEPAAIHIQISPYGIENESQLQQHSLKADSTLRIEYSDSSGSSVNWIDRWPYQNRLPQLIRIYQPDTLHPEWLPLTVEVRRHRHAI